MHITSRTLLAFNCLHKAALLAKTKTKVSKYNAFKYKYCVTQKHVSDTCLHKAISCKAYYYLKGVISQPLCEVDVGLRQYL